jgi:hypothetical protein
MKQGERANYTGSKLEIFIRHILDEKGYTFVDNKKFKAACCLDQQIYTCQFVAGKGIYETPVRCDFIVHHPIKHPECLIIESKWQESSGSVDEKYPYNVLNIQQKLGYPAIIVLDGGGYKPGAEKWLRSQVGGNLLHVFNMMEFQRWSNSDAL